MFNSISNNISSFISSLKLEYALTPLKNTITPKITENFSVLSFRESPRTWAKNRKIELIIAVGALMIIYGVRRFIVERSNSSLRSFFTSEAKRLGLDPSVITGLENGINNILYRTKGKEEHEDMSLDAIYNPLKNDLVEISDLFRLNPEKEKDDAKTATLIHLSKVFGECFTGYGIGMRYCKRSFYEPTKVEEKIPYFVQCCKENALNEMIETQHQEYVNRQNTGRVPEFIKRLGMHDPNKLALLIDLVGDKIGIPKMQISDIKYAKKNYQIPSDGEELTLTAFYTHFYSKEKLIAFLEQKINHPDYGTLVQNLQLLLQQQIYNNQELYKETVLNDFKESSDTEVDSEVALFRHIDAQLTERIVDDEGYSRLKLKTMAFEILLDLYAKEEKFSA